VPRDAQSATQNSVQFYPSLKVDVPLFASTKFSKLSPKTTFKFNSDFPTVAFGSGTPLDPGTMANAAFTALSTAVEDFLSEDDFTGHSDLDARVQKLEDTLGSLNQMVLSLTHGVYAPLDARSTAPATPLRHGTTNPHGKPGNN